MVYRIFSSVFLGPWTSNGVDYRATSGLRARLASSEVLNQSVEFILGQVVRSAVLVVRVVDGPYFFQRSRGAVVQVRRRQCNVGQRWRLQKA